MTTNEACEKFGLEKKELYKRIKAGMIPGVVKKGRMFVIPNETPFIPSEQEIRTAKRISDDVLKLQKPRSAGQMITIISS